MFDGFEIASDFTKKNKRIFPVDYWRLVDFPLENKDSPTKHTQMNH